MTETTIPVKIGIIFMVGMFLFALGVGYMSCYLVDRRFGTGQPMVTEYNIPAADRVWVDTTVILEQSKKKNYQVRWIEYGTPRFVIVESEEARDRVEAWLKGGAK